MTDRNQALVRAFKGTLADAQGLLAVERATFDESPYTAEQVRSMLTAGPQRAWLALAADRVVGFVVAFATVSLSGPSWELDLLAVAPRWRGRGLATRLIRAAAEGGAQAAGRVRAVVATDNDASARAFVHGGFRPAPTTSTLLVYRPKEAGLRPRSAHGVTVRETYDLAEAAAWLPPGRAAEPAGQARRGGPLLLLAEEDGRPAGYAELVEVQTLLYRGAWIESLLAPARAGREALVEQALARGVAAGWDEVGAMVAAGDWPLKNTLVAQGFRSLGDFRWLVADLPLSNSASRPRESGPGKGPGG